MLRHRHQRAYERESALKIPDQLVIGSDEFAVLTLRESNVKAVVKRAFCLGGNVDSTSGQGKVGVKNRPRRRNLAEKEGRVSHSNELCLSAFVRALAVSPCRLSGAMSSWM